MLAGPLVYASPFLDAHMALFDSPKYTNITNIMYLDLNSKSGLIVSLLLLNQTQESVAYLFYTSEFDVVLMFACKKRKLSAKKKKKITFEF